MTREHYYIWKWDLESTPEALWPLVSDTNRFNRDSGLPPMKIMGLDNGVYRLRYKVPLIVVEWDEEPFEWTYPRTFGILRKYRKGPFKEIRTVLTLEPRQPSGSQLRYEVWAQPANFIGSLSIPLAIGLISARRFEKVFQRYDRIAKSGRQVAESFHQRKLRFGGRKRLLNAEDKLNTQGVEPEIFQKLIEFLDSADDLSVQRMRPFLLADHWGQDRRSVLEMFLYATRLGLLDMYWELMCPQCRRMAESNASLDEVKSNSHCNTCNIDFRANFDHNVEVIFRPNPSIRVVDASVQFCVGSPQYQPHVVMSQQVSSLREAPEHLHLEPGRYNLSASNVPGILALSANPAGPSESILRVSDFGWPDQEQIIGVDPNLRLVNATDRTQTFQMSRLTWSDQAATGADVIILQVFRDLFANEVLRPGEEISVGSVTLMFTDLYESTRLYQKIGDAPAFGRVREHFTEL
ncbi:MAG: DUF5939 domain-containing protein [Anaerolineae bacterium]|nr:DUF5939 domain-containing protein [Anaerolineae bacterium]